MPLPPVTRYCIGIFSVLDKRAAGNQQSDEETQQTDCTDKTGVIILSLDNRQSCHVIPMQLHRMIQQLLERNNNGGMTVLWLKWSRLHMEEKCLWILIRHERQSTRNKHPERKNKSSECSFIHLSEYRVNYLDAETRLQLWTTWNNSNDVWNHDEKTSHRNFIKLQIRPLENLVQRKHEKFSFKVMKSFFWCDIIHHCCTACDCRSLARCTVLSRRRWSFLNKNRSIIIIEP